MVCAAGYKGSKNKLLGKIPNYSRHSCADEPSLQWNFYAILLLRCYGYEKNNWCLLDS